MEMTTENREGPGAGLLKPNGPKIAARSVVGVARRFRRRPRSPLDHGVGLLRANPEAYAARLELHLLRHLEPFARGEPALDNIEEAG